jgi:type III secretion system FlhB-like substrate exporter
MTDTIDGVAAEAGRQEPVVPAIDEQSVAEQLVAQAREKGVELIGPDGLFSQLTKRVLDADVSDSWLRQARSGWPQPLQLP